MEERNLKLALASIVEALSEVGYGAPEGVLYAVLMTSVNLQDFELVMRTLKGAGLVTVRSRIVELTRKGEELARKIREAKNGVPQAQEAHDAAQGLSQ